MASQQTKEALGHAVDLLPEGLCEPQFRQRFRKLADRLDELLGLDESGELVVDQDALLKIAHDRDLMPAEYESLIVRETQKHLGHKLKKLGPGHRVGWREAAQHGSPIRPEPVEVLRGLGIDKSSSVDDLRRILREQYPDSPSYWLEADAATIRDTALRVLAHNRTLWDCMVAHQGYWGALAAFAAIGGLIIYFTATAGPAGPILVYSLIAILGSGTAFMFLTCFANPDW